MKFIPLSIFLLLITQLSYSQTSVTPEIVINTYITAIGGEKNIKKIKTLKKISTQMVAGEAHSIEEKIETGTYYSMERTFSNGNQQAIVSKEGGVNITSDGIFRMPPNQHTRFLEDSDIFPELTYFKEGYTLKYHGIYELDADTKCHEISVKRPDNSTIYREYNVETGLLELIVNKRNKKRILEYEATSGILFPKKYTENGRLFQTKNIEINPKFTKEEFIWNTNNDLALVGRWEAVGKTNEAGQKQVSFIELHLDRGGKDGIGVLANDKVSEAKSLTFSIHSYYNRQLKEIKEYKFRLLQNKRITSRIWSIRKSLEFKPWLQSIESVAF